MEFLGENGLLRLWEHINSKLSNKVDKINGKKLSTNDYTTEDKEKLNSIEFGAEANAVDSVNGKTGNVMLTSEDIGADGLGAADAAVYSHNVSSSAHNDIRSLISTLTNRLNAFANSTDEDLAQMAEIVSYIQSNKSLIDAITTSKVNVSDIIDNLETNITNKPLSAAQGVAIKNLITALENEVNEKALSNDLVEHENNGNVHVTPNERTLWNDSNSKKHEHENKDVLDIVDGSDIDNWNNAYSHSNNSNAHLPSVTTEHNDMFCRVVNGAWAAVVVPNVEEVMF